MKKAYIFFFMLIVMVVLTSNVNSAIVSIENTPYAAPNNDFSEPRESTPLPASETSDEQEYEGDDISCSELPLCKSEYFCINDEQCLSTETTSCCNTNGKKSSFNECKYDISVSYETLEKYNIIMDHLYVKCCHSPSENTYFCEDDPSLCSFNGIDASYLTQVETFLINNSDLPSTCSDSGIENTQQIKCKSSSNDELLICAGDFYYRPDCLDNNYDPYPTKPIGKETMYFPCNTQLTYNKRKLFGFQTFPKEMSCSYIIEQKEENLNEVWIIKTEGTEEPSDSTEMCLDENTGKVEEIYKICGGYTTKQWCEDNNGTSDESMSCAEDPTLFLCKCSDDYLSIEEIKNSCKHTTGNIIGKGTVCTAETTPKYNDYEINLDIPTCDSIINAGNSYGDLNQPRDGWYSTILNEEDSPEEITCYDTDYLKTTIYKYCSEENVESSFLCSECNSYDKTTSCSYPSTAGTTLQVCSQCSCDTKSLKTKEEFCKFSEDNGYISPSEYNKCLNEGIFSGECKLNPTTSLYKKVSCPSEYLTLSEWWSANKTSQSFDEFLARRLEIKNIDQWMAYYTPDDSSALFCNYAAEVKKTESEAEITHLPSKAKSYKLGCAEVQKDLTQDLEYLSNGLDPNQIKITSCWDHEDKFFASCTTDYILPSSTYVPSPLQTEDFCVFEKLKYFKHGGNCPTNYTGNEAILSTEESDEKIKETYGNVSITTCNDDGTKKKLISCDPEIYNHICEYPYEYETTPTTSFCRRGENNHQISATDPKYYSSVEASPKCIYNPSNCDLEISEKTAANYYAEIVNTPNECLQKFGSAAQTKTCQDRNKTTKYCCFYKNDEYIFNTANCSIGKDLSGPYIIKNGTKHWKSCDCAPSYKYHLKNCSLKSLQGSVCVQENITTAFLEKRPYETELIAGDKNIALYTQCKDAEITNESGCSTPEGTWATCYYCCPKTKKATGKLSINGCGQKIYECK